MTVLSIRGSLEDLSSSRMISRMNDGSESCTFAAGLEVTASVGAALTTVPLASFAFSVSSVLILESIETVSVSNAREQRMTTAAKMPAASINCFEKGVFTVLSFEGYKGRKRAIFCNSPKAASSGTLQAHVRPCRNDGYWVSPGRPGSLMVRLEIQKPA